MKVITKSVMDIESGEILLEESYEYDGEVALCKGGKLGAQRAERQATEEQTTALRKNRQLLEKTLHRQELLEPLFFESAGIKAIRDDNGEIISFEKIEDPLDPIRADLEKTLLDRSLSAAKGEIPAYLTDFREEQKANMEDVLRSQLGSDFATSSPGIEALTSFDKETTRLGQQLNLQELGLGSGISLNRESAQRQRTIGDLDIFGQTAKIGSGADFSSIAGGYDNILNRAGQDRRAREQQQSQIYGQIGNAVGTVAGYYYGGAAGGKAGGSAGGAIGSWLGGES